MTDSIFTKIIKGEVPAYKIYEDDFATAILDIEPKVPGHLLVVPRKQIDKFYEMSDEDFARLMILAKRIATVLEKVSGLRVVLKIVGTDVPHVHIHLMPLSDGANKLAGKTLEEIARIIEEERR